MDDAEDEDMLDVFIAAGKTPEALERVANARRLRENDGMTFLLEGDELASVHKFENEHDAMHGLYAGAIGGRFTISFTPTSIGTLVSVKCGNCGAEHDATKFGDW